MGIHNLDQISLWDAQCQIWKGWTFPNIPIEMEASLTNLKTHLHGIAPTKRNSDDGFRWDPSGSNYIVKAAYQ